MILNTEIDMTDTMYPAYAVKMAAGTVALPNVSTAYGYVLSGEVHLPNGNTAFEGQYFCLWAHETKEIHVEGEAVVFIRAGFKGQNTVGGPIEESGRLCYIDTCSDSLLIYPPRQGDPTLNALYFPTGVDQSFHIHPSIRFGVVAKGGGFACTKKDGSVVETPLQAGDMFCIEEREVHRFRTTDNEMVVIAFHPDGDWGPTDHNHTMLNRTYRTGVSN